MSTTFRLNADDLEASFVEKLKVLFAHKDIAVVVYEEDETDRIRANPELHSRLLAAQERVERGEGVVTVSLDELRKQHSREMLFSTIRLLSSSRNGRR